MTATKPRRKKFVLRKIRDGRVRIYGHDYAPKEPLRPEHEGQKALFGTYRGYEGGEEFLPFVALWGSEAEARDYRPDGEFDPTGLAEGENGVRYFAWCWWNRVAADEART